MMTRPPPAGVGWETIVMKRILGMFFLALALGGALAVVLPADPAEALNGNANGNRANGGP